MAAGRHQQVYRDQLLRPQPKSRIAWSKSNLYRTYPKATECQFRNEPVFPNLTDWGFGRSIALLILFTWRGIMNEIYAFFRPKHYRMTAERSVIDFDADNAVLAHLIGSWCQLTGLVSAIDVTVSRSVSFQHVPPQERKKKKVMLVSCQCADIPQNNIR